jgi:glycosyl transferase family 87
MNQELRTWWRTHSEPILRFAVITMAVAAVVWLSYQFWRLLWQETPIWPTSPTGAVDLKQRHEEVHRWFAGMPVYGELWTATYPPVSYLILWPLLGWLTVPSARYLWAATTVAALLWTICLILRESGAERPLERMLVALMPLSIYATGATIGNGQLMVHALPILIVALLQLHRAEGGWRTDLFAAGLFLLALVKPSVTIPFVWMLLFVPRRLRPALLVASGYGALTVVAASFQELGLVRVGRAWVTHGIEVSAAVSLSWNRINLNTLAALLGPSWTLPASLFVLAGLGWWTLCNRRADPWLLLGVTAVTARFWTYHAWYDDILVLLPLVALFRIAKRSESEGGRDVIAGLLFAITISAMLAPGGLYLLPPPWKIAYVIGQVMLWLTILLFLLGQVRRKRNMIATSG